jgi:type II secretory pathway component PulF
MSTTPPKSTIQGTAFRAGLAVLLWALLLFAFFIAVPVHKKTFDEYGLMLPQLTMAFMDIAAWLADFYWIALPALAAAAALLCLVTYFIRHKVESRFLSALWTIAIISLPVLCHALFWFSMWLPHVKLQEALNR